MRPYPKGIVRSCRECVEEARRHEELGNISLAAKKARECIQIIKGAIKLLYKQRADMSVISYLESLLEEAERIASLKPSSTAKSSRAKPSRSSNKRPSSDKASGDDDRLIVKRPKIKFSDLVAVEKIVSAVVKKLRIYLDNPDIARKLKISAPKGFLLYGPPGCGKTTIAQALAGEFGMPLIIASASSILSKRRGESEARVRMMFKKARQMAPAVVLIDEVDALVPTEASEHARRLEAEFLQNLDGALSESDKVVLVVMTTNYPRRLSEPFIRRAKEGVIYTPPPNRNVRKALFIKYLEGVPKEDIDYDELAELTKPKGGTYYAHSSIAEIVDKAKVLAADEALEKKEEPKVKMKHLREAINSVFRPIHEAMIRRYLEWGKKFGAIIPYEVVD